MFASPSIGVAVSSTEHRSGDEVVRDADLAMYRAKGAGGGRYAVFDAAMHEAAVERLRLETELRRAVERQEFRLWYQPIVALADRQVAGFEALVRWQHPERGLLAPGAFLPVAEELGLIASIDEWVLGEACRQGQQWRREHPDAPTMHRQRQPVGQGVRLRRRSCRDVVEALRATGLPARGLQARDHRERGGRRRGARPAGPHAACARSACA